MAVEWEFLGLISGLNFSTKYKKCDYVLSYKKDDAFHLHSWEKFDPIIGDISRLDLKLDLVPNSSVFIISGRAYTKQWEWRSFTSSDELLIPDLLDSIKKLVLTIPFDLITDAIDCAYQLDKANRDFGYAQDTLLDTGKTIARMSKRLDECKSLLPPFLRVDK